MSRIRKVIYQDILEKNYNKITIKSNYKKIIWMLKGNAYGHGLFKIADFLISKNESFFGFYGLDEPLIFDKKYKEKEIFILDSFTFKEWGEFLQIPKLNNKWIICLNKFEDLEFAKQIKNPNVRFHVFVETGFHWYGVKNIKKFCEKALELKIQISGICSHFAMSSKPFEELTINQQKEFDRKFKIAEKYFPNIETHLGNSNAMFNGLGEQYSYFRIGRALYGGIQNFEQILRVEVDILQIKSVKKGETIGYFGAYKAEKDMRIAVIAAGYKDNIDFRLSNNGFFVINNVLCPIVGNVAMSTCFADISNVLVKSGDTAIFTDNIDGIKIQGIVNRISSSDYEFLTKFSLVP